MDLLQVLHRLLDGDVLKALDLLFLGLGAGGHRGLGAEAVDELLEVGDFALLVLEDGGLLLLAGDALGEVVVVVAGVAVERAAAQLEDAGAEDVEEGAVVGNDQQAARVTRQVILEPEQRLEIEVVGRLVEDKQGGLGDEQAGEMGAHDPATGERLGELVGVTLLEAEAGEDLFGVGLEGPVDVPVVVVLRDQLFATGGDLEDGFVADGGAFLREKAEVGAAFPLDGTGVLGLLAEDQVEQGGFARAIGADEAVAVGARDEERHVVEEFTRAVGLGNIGDGKHRNRSAHGMPGPASMRELRMNRGCTEERNYGNPRGFSVFPC